MITHANLLSASTSGLEGCIRATQRDVYLSFLPLPHIFERLVINSLLSCGCSVGFFRSNPLLIIDDIKALEPTIFCAVPRLLNKIFDKVIQGANANPGSVAARMFNSGLQTKLSVLRETGGRSHWLWDRLIFNKLKTALGLRHTRIMLSGGAPLSSDVMEFFRITLGQGCNCHEGYGQTETSGGTTMTSAEDSMSTGHVGSPFPAAEIKLVDVPDMGYLHTDVVHGSVPCVGRGEIWVRGPLVFQGYYKDPDATKEALTPDGWLKSGDVGIWLPDGQLQIVDRKKNIFKLAQGEFVAVEKIEGTLGQAPLVGMLLVHGEPTESSLVGVVVVDEDAYNNSLRTVMGSSLAIALSDSKKRMQLTETVLGQLDSTGREAGLKGYELVKAVHLEAAPWTASDALPILTPTMKLQRGKAKERYKKELEGLFSRLKTAARAKL
jgi:long-chain acyl-CoA synthetase